MSYNVKDIAHKILFKATKEKGGNLICHLKLQKILYYMQGFYLAYFDKPFFKEEIEAWKYGPVVPSIYEKYKKHKNSGIAYKGDDTKLKTKEEENIFNEIYGFCSIHSATELMKLTHSEDPWKSTPTGKGNIIKKDAIKESCKKRSEEFEMLEDVKAYDNAKAEFEKNPKCYTWEEVKKSLYS